MFYVRIFHLCILTLFTTWYDHIERLSILYMFAVHICTTEKLNFNFNKKFLICIKNLTRIKLITYDVEPFILWQRVALYNIFYMISIIYVTTLRFNLSKADDGNVRED